MAARERGRAAIEATSSSAARSNGSAIATTSRAPSSRNGTTRRRTATSAGTSATALASAGGGFSNQSIPSSVQRSLSEVSATPAARMEVRSMTRRVDPFTASLAGTIVSSCEAARTLKRCGHD